ncbi:MAG: type IV toxin-antitoxin system AbiEi family antitoxin domain-containing protein [Actinomycetota bacterium]
MDYRVVRVVKRKFFGFRKEWIEEAQINFTDREKTVIDCLDLPQYAGGVVEVAKALKRGEFDWERMIGYLERFGNTGVNRRLGYLCDHLRLDVDLPAVNTRNYLLLDPTMPGDGVRNARWRLMVNLDEKSLGELE